MSGISPSDSSKVTSQIVYQSRGNFTPGNGTGNLSQPRREWKKKSLHLGSKWPRLAHRLNLADRPTWRLCFPTSIAGHFGGGGSLRTSRRQVLLLKVAGSYPLCAGGERGRKPRREPLFGRRMETLQKNMTTGSKFAWLLRPPPGLLSGSDGMARFSLPFEAWRLFLLTSNLLSRAGRGSYPSRRQRGNNPASAT